GRPRARRDAPSPGASPRDPRLGRRAAPTTRCRPPRRATCGGTISWARLRAQLVEAIVDELGEDERRLDVDALRRTTREQHADLAGAIDERDRAHLPAVVDR